MIKSINRFVLTFFILFFCSCNNKEIELYPTESLLLELYKESPVLHSDIDAGMIPTVEERIPKNPLLIQNDSSVGIYGGTWSIPIREVKNKGRLVSILGYENLISWDPEWTKVIPNIAQSWSVNDDSTVYTFKLRDGIRWSDGELFSVDDILFYFEIMNDIEVNRWGLPKWLIVDDKNVEVKKVGDNSVSFTFASSYGLFLQKLATTSGTRLTGMPKHYLEQFLLENSPEVLKSYKEGEYDSWQDQFFNKADFSHNIELPTLNPWLLLDTYSPLETDIIRAKRNPYYWKIDSDFNQLPYIDNLKFVVCEDDEEVNTRTLAGEFEMSMSDLPLDSISKYKTMANSGDYHLFSKVPSSMNNMTLEFNLNHPDPVKREMFLDKNFRIALSHAINREKIIEDIYHGEGVPYQLAPRPESPLYNEKLAKQYTEYNLELAKKILDTNGYLLNNNGKRTTPNGEVISITVVIADLFGKNWLEAIEYIKTDWEALGVELLVKRTDWKGLDKFRNSALHDLLVWQGSGGLEVKIIPDYYLPFGGESGYAMKWMWWYLGGNDFYPREEPPEFVKKQMYYFDEIKSTGDPVKQDELMTKILDISVSQFYALGISLPGKSYGIAKSNFKNVPLLMPQSWAFPTPAPTNPCQYYFE